MNGSVTLTEAVAAAVRTEMRQQGKAVMAVAAALGVSEMYVSRRLNGHVAFDLADLQRIADALGVPASRFLDVVAATGPQPSSPQPSRPQKRTERVGA